MTTTTEYPRKRRRVFMWFFLAVQTLFILWLAVGVGSASGDQTDCGSLTQQQCNDAAGAGTAIGAVLVIGLWMMVDFLLAVGYVIYRLAKRP